ncbi:hypothetical protein DESC_600033 [Desulfosarcina cetonica]|nr:hypothetical protein DESC_600033 [Desulfosarcina cetonica]
MRTSRKIRVFYFVIIFKGYELTKSSSGEIANTWSMICDTVPQDDRIFKGRRLDCATGGAGLTGGDGHPIGFQSAFVYNLYFIITVGWIQFGVLF